jgi:hypothetical protein
LTGNGATLDNSGDTAKSDEKQAENSDDELNERAKLRD